MLRWRELLFTDLVWVQRDFTGPQLLRLQGSKRQHRGGGGRTTLRARSPPVPSDPPFKGSVQQRAEPLLDNTAAANICTTEDSSFSKGKVPASSYGRMVLLRFLVYRCKHRRTWRRVDKRFRVLARIEE